MHSSLQILTDGGVVTTVNMCLVPMKFHLMSKGPWRPQMDCFQFSVLFCDEVSRVFLHFVRFVLFRHLMTPCPTSTAIFLFAFCHPCSTNIFWSSPPQLIQLYYILQDSETSRNKSLRFFGYAHWIKQWSLLQTEKHVVLFTWKTSLGNPSTARRVKGVCYAPFHCSHFRIVFLLYLSANMSRITVLYFC